MQKALLITAVIIILHQVGCNWGAPVTDLHDFQRLIQSKTKLLEQYEQLLKNKLKEVEKPDDNQSLEVDHRLNEIESSSSEESGESVENQMSDADPEGVTAETAPPSSAQADIYSNSAKLNMALILQIVCVALTMFGAILTMITIILLYRR